MAKRKLTQAQKENLIEILKARFQANMHRHKNIEWSNVEKNLEVNTNKLWSLNEMESKGGEPDVVEYDAKTNTYVFYDCSVESPKHRRSLCYDRAALEARKSNKPDNSVLDMAKTMNVELLSEEQYRTLQQLGEFDTKTSSWINTPNDIRDLGGALFCDRRYNKVITYHNGAESYYASRGFRCAICI